MYDLWHLSETLNLVGLHSETASAKESVSVVGADRQERTPRRFAAVRCDDRRMAQADVDPCSIERPGLDHRKAVSYNRLLERKSVIKNEHLG